MIKNKRALITGITGQDGSYLTEFLLEKGYDVHGIVRRVSTFHRNRIEHLYKTQYVKEDNLHLHYGDLSDSSNLNRLISKIQPDEIYNLAAQSHVKVSFEIPEYTVDVDGIGTLRLLDAIRDTGTKTRFYQASTSELFGKVMEVPQSESTPFYPRSPYAAAKLFAHWIVVNYREAYSMHSSNGILFNHESPRRGENFVTRKITKGVAGIKTGQQKHISVGNINALRDWGYAPDYVKAMWMMLQKETPDDYVIATGEMHSVREFIEKAFECAGIYIEWEGTGLNEIGIDNSTGQILIKINPNYFRPTEVDQLLGDSSKAKKQLGWEPSISFEEIIEEMVKFDLDTAKSKQKELVYDTYK